MALGLVVSAEPTHENLFAIRRTLKRRKTGIALQCCYDYCRKVCDLFQPICNELIKIAPILQCVNFAQLVIESSKLGGNMDEDQKRREDASNSANGLFVFAGFGALVSLFFIIQGASRSGSGSMGGLADLAVLAFSVPITIILAVIGLFMKLGSKDVTPPK